jgi:hypothetical protein
MRWVEKLYERPLKRHFDEQTRQAVNSELTRRRQELPVPTEVAWSKSKPEVTIRAPWLAVIVQFSEQRLVVKAELSLAAKMLVTAENRRDAVRLIESVADDLNL